MTDQPGPNPLHQRVMTSVRAIGAVSERIGQAFAHRHHLHPTDVRALLAVTVAETAGRPMTAGDLARELRLTSGAVTQAVDRLIASGHVRRRPDAADRRRVWIVQQETGHRMAGAFFAPLAHRGAAVMDHYSDDDLRTVQRFLDELNQQLLDHVTDLDDASSTGG